MFAEWANEGQFRLKVQVIPGGPVIKNPPCNAGAAGSTPGLRN